MALRLAPKWRLLVNVRGIEAMDSMIADAEQRGAKIEAGGKRIVNKDNFFEPTILTNVP